MGSRARQLVAGLRQGAAKLSGFALSMVVLALAGLAIIPVMIAASGPEAWGKIAVGQAVGAVSAVLLALGWGVSGPARIARGGDAARGREYLEALVCKLALLLPLAGASFLLAWLLAGEHRLFAAVAAVTATGIGLTSNWYFVGLARPYQFLLLETLPRVAGTLVGIVVMVSGQSAVWGLLCQLAGLLLAAAVCAAWILGRRRVPLSRVRLRDIPRIVGVQRHGLSATVMSAAYSASPVLVVGLVSPTLLPAYALLDKVFRQVNAGLAPYVTVLQGWVPRGPDSAVWSRVRRGMVLTGALAAVGGVLLFLVSPWLVALLGGAEIRLSWLALLLMAALVAVSVTESVYSKACLPALDRVDVAAHATSASMVVGLALVLVAARWSGVEAVAAAVLAGLVLRLLAELLATVLWARRRRGMLHPGVRLETEEQR